jgi:hypothetical protein
MLGVWQVGVDGKRYADDNCQAYLRSTKGVVFTPCWCMHRESNERDGVAKVYLLVN